MPSSVPPSPALSRPSSLLGWRLLALAYDVWPALALWMLVAVPFTLGHTFLGQHDPHQNITPYSPLAWLLWASCWLVTGLYATISWRRGGQTLGMRPWRLHLASANADAPTWRAVWLRFLVGTVSLLGAGLGFWWAWVDRDRLTWHDRASGLRLTRRPR